MFQRCKNSFYNSVMNRLRNLRDHWSERGVRQTVTVRERRTLINSLDVISVMQMWLTWGFIYQHTNSFKN